MKKVNNICRLFPLLLAFIGLALSGYKSDLPVGIAYPRYEATSTNFTTALHRFEKEQAALKPMPIFLSTNYFIAATGSTSNTGLSPSSPWPESKVASFSFGAGDNILFNKGDTFSGTITFTSSGSSGNPITFDLYGSAANNATLDGAATTSAALLTISGNYVTINNLVLQNDQNANGLLYLTTAVHDITVNNCSFNTGIRGVNAVNCGTSGVANIVIENSYFTNIYDTLNSSTQDLQHGGGNAIQLNNCNGAGIEIAYNWCYEPAPSSANNFNHGVGDIISLFQDNGTSASWILVHDNNIRGGSNNQVTGYIGITVGDVGGSYQHVYNNTLCSSGQGAFGIMPTGGTNLTVENNLAYGAPTTNTHNFDGMGFNDASGVATCIMQNNHLTWNVNGGTILNKFATNGPPTGWTTNTADHAVDPLAFDAMLPDPLWTGSPWNTRTTYYFSSSGSTSNTGLSIASPWPLSKINTVGNGGDSILIKKGDVLTGTINYTRSGVSGSPIVFDCYGTAHNNPVLDGGGTGTPTLTLTGSYINVNNLVIQSSASVNGNLYVTSANHDININNVYTTGGYRGFYFYLCGSGGVANLTVKNCYFYNIGVGGSRASGSGSSVQMNGCNGAGIEVAFDYAQTDMTLSTAQRDGVGDIFNFYQCNGTSGSYILAHDLNVRGGSSSTSGYAGLILGDVGGSYQNGYNNIFVQSGSQGFQIQGGTFITANNNKMYSPTYSYMFEGIGFGNYSGAPCNNITITNNKVNWTNGSGSSLAYWIDSPGNSGLSTQTGAAGGATLTADFTGTTSQFTKDLTMTNSLLPDPLYSVSAAPWNTSTTPLSFSPLASKAVGAADYSPGAVSSSNQGITYTSNNTSVATIVSGKIHVVAAGTANITANDQFDTVTQTLVVTSTVNPIKYPRKVKAS